MSVLHERGFLEAEDIVLELERFLESSSFIESEIGLEDFVVCLAGIEVAEVHDPCLVGGFVDGEDIFLPPSLGNDGDVVAHG